VAEELAFARGVEADDRFELAGVGGHLHAG
jgi:hypothetical protein